MREAPWGWRRRWLRLGNVEAQSRFRQPRQTLDHFVAGVADDRWRCHEHLLHARFPGCSANSNEFGELLFVVSGCIPGHRAAQLGGYVSGLATRLEVDLRALTPTPLLPRWTGILDAEAIASISAAWLAGTITPIVEMPAHFAGFRASKVSTRNIAIAPLKLTASAACRGNGL